MIDKGRELVTTSMMITRRTPGNEDGAQQEITIDGYVTYYTDTQYGQDADGNRGTCRTSVEKIEDLGAWDDTFQEIDLTEEEKQKPAGRAQHWQC